MITFRTSNDPSDTIVLSPETTIRYIRKIAISFHRSFSVTTLQRKTRRHYDKRYNSYIPTFFDRIHQLKLRHPLIRRQFFELKRNRFTIQPHLEGKWNKSTTRSLLFHLGEIRALANQSSDYIPNGCWQMLTNNGGVNNAGVQGSTPTVTFSRRPSTSITTVTLLEEKIFRGALQL